MTKDIIAEQVNASFKSTLNIKQEHKKIQELRKQIDRLTQKDEERESLLKELRLQLEQQSGKFSIPIDKIKPSDQCRLTFTQALINKRVESLKAKGQLQPLILIVPKDKSDCYYLEDGELTWRAACQLVESGEENWRNLDAVYSNFDEAENVHRRTLIHHLHSEGLTPLDRAEGLVRELKVEIDEEEIEIVKLLRNIKYILEKKEKEKRLLQRLETEGIKAIKTELISAGISPKQFKMLSFLQEFQINFSSFVANDLNMVLLCDDLKEAARKFGLGSHLAKILNQLQAKKLNCSEDKALAIRVKATNEVIELGLSVKETRKMVSSILAKNSSTQKNSQTKKAFNSLKNSLTSLSTVELNFEELESLKLIMQEKLADIEDRLAIRS